MTREEILQAAVLSLILGMERNAAHAKQGSHRPLSEDYEPLGIFGECKFGNEFGLPVDMSLRLGGDNGIDFRTPFGTIDVKTARKPGNLIVEVSKIDRAADFLVLCKFSGFTLEAELLGWERRAALKAAPITDFGYGVINHYIPAERLRPMQELREILSGKRSSGRMVSRCAKHGEYDGDGNCEQCELERFGLEA